MDKKRMRNIVITVIVIVLLFGGAALGYRSISGKVDPYATNKPSQSSKTEDETPLAENETSSSMAESSAPEPDVVEAPDFLVYDEDGEEVRLSDYKGTPVILNFWASWCPPCQIEMPYFQTQYDKYSDSGDVVFLMVNFTGSRGETVESASAYMDEEGFTFPIVFDTQMEAVQRYGVSGIPVTYFINEEGHVVSGVGGSISEKQLEDSIESLLEVTK